MEQRGTIIHRERAKQLRDFSGLKYGNITPTDIDGFIDFGDRAFVFFEIKCEGMVLPVGQRLALERVTDAAEMAGKYSFAIIAEHNTPVQQDIDVANCIATETRWKMKWTIFKERHTLKQIIDNFLNKYLPSYLIAESEATDKA